MKKAAEAVACLRFPQIISFKTRNRMSTQEIKHEEKPVYVRIHLRQALPSDFHYMAHGEKVYRYGAVYFTRLIVDGKGGWEPHAFTRDSLAKFSTFWNAGSVWVADRPVKDINPVRSSQVQGGSLENTEPVSPA